MQDDRSIKWTLANPLTIRRDESGNAWNAGAARDIVSLDEDRVLVATDTGGIWLAGRDGSALPVADVEYPDFWCITNGQYGNDHFYAGGKRLYETDISKPASLLHWREIPVTWEETGSDGKLYTVSPSRIYRIVILKGDKRIILATRNGIIWADIPPPPERPTGCLVFGAGPGSTPAPYKWRKARGLDSFDNDCLGLAAGASAEGEIKRSVSVASWGKRLGKITHAMQFYRGEWEAGDLVLRKAEMAVVEGLDATAARATTLASCEKHPERQYAISSTDTGFPALFWISTDDGRNWTPIDPKLVEPNDKTFAEAAGNLGNHMERPCNCIAASRQNPDIVVVGWRFEGFFYSEDAGKTWRRTDTERSLHTHADVHGIYFDATDPAGTRVFIAHDGGISMAPDLGKAADQVESYYNRQMATLQFQTAPSRQFYGRASANPADSGAMIGGLQDNGVVTSSVYPSIEPWIKVAGGDGLQATFLSLGHALWNNNDDGIPNQSGTVRHSFWTAMHELFQTVYVPVKVFYPAMPFLAGLPESPGETVVFSPVLKPEWTNREGEKMYAVAGKKSTLFGLFYSNMGTEPHWDYLASFSLNDHLSEADVKAKNWEPWAISAVGSVDGGTIYVGTNGGRLIMLEQVTHVAHEITVPLRKNPWGDAGSEINRIVVAHNRLAFALYNMGPGEGYVLRIQPPKSNVLKALPVESYYGIEVARGREQASLFVATDNHVYVSQDGGDALGNTWARASTGLPKRAHCGDLSYVEQPNGERWLYMSSYGRSFWRARR